uniref:Lcl C-terminal domain-containing protein n=1 Tax=uncultured Acinetobacter sp. TaxID=165433 RepID=UPI002634D400|nr:DUF1566 domain-containing protein [uncultured Acinetobacter sp.]
MKRSLIYTAVFSAMMMVTGCGGGESNSAQDTADQTAEKRNLTYATDEDGNYYLDFSEINSNAKAIIQTSGNFYTYDDIRKEGTYGDLEGLKTYYNENNIIKFEYLENNVVKADFFDRKSGFVKRIFAVTQNGQLYVQETTDIDVVNIDESKPLTLHSGVINEINKIIDIVDPLPITASSTLAKGINFSFFPTANAAEYGVAERSYRNDKTGSAIGIIFVAFGLGEVVGGTALVAAQVALPISIAILGTIILYENNQKFRNFLDNNFDYLKKAPVNLLNDMVNILIPNANASEEEIEYWRKLLEEEKKKCLASGMKLINGVCKKEEEPQCLADEILVNGVCKKKEPVCLADEILVDGICKKKEPVCLADEILVDGICKKVDPVCAEDEVLENGQCIKQPVTTTGFTKISAKGKKLPDSATEWDCVLDNETGLMWEYKTTDGGLRDSTNYYSWFEDSTGIADPRDRYIKEYGYESIPNEAKPYGFYCNYTLSKCNTKDFIKAINIQKLCGYSDWRMPNKNELLEVSIKQISHSTNYLNHSGDTWSSSIRDDTDAWYVRLAWGKVEYGSKVIARHIQVVRSK